MIHLTLPVPPISNTMYRNFRGRTVKTKEVKNYQDQVKLICMTEKIKPLSGEIEVVIHWHRAQKRGDIDGRLKVILDALQGVCYKNDSQICSLWIWRFEAPTYPRMEVMISQFKE